MEKQFILFYVVINFIFFRKKLEINILHKITPKNVSNKNIKFIDTKKSFSF